jgi:hypothetical protein
MKSDTTVHSIFRYLETQFEVTEGLNYSGKFIDAPAQLVFSRAENFMTKTASASK